MAEGGEGEDEIQFLRTVSTSDSLFEMHRSSAVSQSAVSCVVNCKAMGVAAGFYVTCLLPSKLLLSRESF